MCFDHLKDLIKDTLQTHPDYANLCAAEAKLREVTHNINDARRAAESLEKVFSVQTKLTENTGGDDLPVSNFFWFFFAILSHSYVLILELGRATPHVR